MKKYNVYLNWKFVGSVDTEEEAWDLIEEGSWGDIVEVRDDNGKIREEFIPL